MQSAIVRSTETRESISVAVYITVTDKLPRPSHTSGHYACANLVTTTFTRREFHSTTQLTVDAVTRFGSTGFGKLFLFTMLKFAVKRKASDIFHEAVLTKDLARVKFLLMNNNEQFNVDELDSDGLTALQRSCFTGNTKLVQLLVTYGANLLIQDKEGWTLLHAAAVAGNNTILRYLVAMGADVCVRNDQGDMAIDLAADIETVIILAEAMQRVGMVAEIASFLAKKPEMKESLKEKVNRG